MGYLNYPKHDFGDAGSELTLQKAVTSGRRAAAMPCSSICEQSCTETQNQ